MENYNGKKCDQKIKNKTLGKEDREEKYERKKHRKNKNRFVLVARKFD